MMVLVIDNARIHHAGKFTNDTKIGNQKDTTFFTYHHIVLILMALDFLLEVKHENAEEMPLLSVPDI
jgi:hypothetical protein